MHLLAVSWQLMDLKAKQRYHIHFIHIAVLVYRAYNSFKQQRQAKRLAIRNSFYTPGILRARSGKSILTTLG
jgi:hypothetical protein